MSIHSIHNISHSLGHTRVALFQYTNVTSLHITYLTLDDVGKEPGMRFGDVSACMVVDGREKGCGEEGWRGWVWERVGGWMGRNGGRGVWVQISRMEGSVCFEGYGWRLV